jgi:hypothetical protein
MMRIQFIAMVASGCTLLAVYYLGLAAQEFLTPAVASHNDPTRLARIRAAKMLPIIKPILFDAPEVNAGTAIEACSIILRAALGCSKKCGVKV